jgi:acetamidase/formamidase
VVESLLHRPCRRPITGRQAQAARDTATLIEESIAKSNDGKSKVDQVATAIRAITEKLSDPPMHNETCPMEVKEARDGDTLARGQALVAPGNLHR